MSLKSLVVTVAGLSVFSGCGTTHPNLDENGVVLWSHDKGYGLPPLKSLLDVLKK